MRMSYAEGLTSPEIEIAEGGTMLDNKSKYADLRMMLDSNREGIKMDAMKRIINMVARGKDVSELFPSVVKNVAVKNLELKKLVYVYLVRYAEEQQDLALLSISTFQRALKDPNQLIRASALRVLSSIRVPMIAPVMLLAIKDSVRDMSAYVRKVAAHAIPKLYALDPELQSQLLECIDYLLADKRTLVLGSAVHAFEETCPERLDLLHKHFRALCRALADVDEWGQVVMIGLLTRYARTQFTSPLGSGEHEPLDPDHSLLILSVKPLLQSRNCAVVMAVAQLLYYIAPHSQLSIVPRSLVRLLRGPNEVQYVILVNIATICAVRNDMVNEKIFAISKNLFEPFLKSFFVRSSDTIHVKQLKLQVLTSLVSETNVQLVIRELQAYLQMSDLADAAIEGIGRCALQVPNAAESCLTCLINLISSNKEQVVCSAVVVLKRLLHADAPLALLKRVLKLIESVKAPTARACVIWLVETHSDKVGHLAPDLLRKLAKTFCDEADCVKLQILNLAVRLWINDLERCELLIRYVLQLARYDRSYDIRDRCRFIRNLLFNFPDGSRKIPFKIFLSNKPAPTVQSQFSDRERFQLGTLSHLLNQKCANYTELPEFPNVAPDPTIRRSAQTLGAEESKVILNQHKIGEEEFSEEDENEEEEDEDDDDEEEEDEDEEDEADEEEESADVSSDSDESEEESSSSESTKNSADSEVEELAQKSKKNIVAATASKVKEPKTVMKPSKSSVNDANLVDLLVDVDFNCSSITLGSGGGVHQVIPSAAHLRCVPLYVPSEYTLLLSPINTGGLLLEARFTRSSSLINPSMVVVEVLVWYRNPRVSDAEVTIRPKENSALSSSGEMVITGLNNDERRTLSLSIDFGDSGNCSEWTLYWDYSDHKRYDFKVDAPFGEQIEPIDLSTSEFELHRAQLTGMHQIAQRLGQKPSRVQQIYKVANCKKIKDSEWNFAAQTVSRKDVVLISLIDMDKPSCQVVVNCENVAFASILCREMCDSLEQ